MDTEIVTILVCEKWNAEHCVFHGIDDAYTAGVPVLLSSNQEGVAQVLKLNPKCCA